MQQEQENKLLFLFKTQINAHNIVLNIVISVEGFIILNRDISISESW